MNHEPDVTQLERRLHRLGTALRAELTTIDVVPAVVDGIRHDRATRDTKAPRRAGRIAALVSAGIVVTTSAAWALKAIVFDGGAVTVHRGPAPTATTPVRRIGLGERITRARARTLAGFLQPHVSWLDAPPTAWVDPAVPEQLSFSYPPGPALAEIRGTGFGMVIQTFAADGREVIRKYLTTDDATAVRVQIAGSDAVFLQGGEHLLFYLRPDGRYRTVPGRLVGNALILRAGRLTVRIEAQLPLARLVEIARSLQPATGR